MIPSQFSCGSLIVCVIAAMKAAILGHGCWFSRRDRAATTRAVEHQAGGHAQMLEELARRGPRDLDPWHETSYPNNFFHLNPAARSAEPRSTIVPGSGIGSPVISMVAAML